MKRTPVSSKLVFCGSGNYGTKAHVAKDVYGSSFHALCKARSSNPGGVFSYTEREIEEENICSKCLKHTKPV
jgi:hypothetical protein